ncbi:MAG: hypothetical protein ABEJ46_02285, partial [Gemmatimonadota bacterium]
MPRLPALSPRRRAIALLASIVMAVLLLAGVMFVGSDIQTGVRAYVTGESLWSRGRARAVEALGQYARMGEEEQWQEYREAIRGLLATRRARVELEKEDPDRERIAALGLEDDVVVEGFVPRGELPEIYRATDLHVVASVDETAGPNTQL